MVLLDILLVDTMLMTMVIPMSGSHIFLPAVSGDAQLLVTVYNVVVNIYIQCSNITDRLTILFICCAVTMETID